jgi:RNA polymerase sigma-70 factor (ECF subfamily)
MDQFIKTRILTEFALKRADFAAFVRRRAPSSDAEDLVQQAFARAQEKIDTLRNPATATAWFYRILRRLIIDYHERQNSRAAKLEQLATNLDDLSPLPADICTCGFGLMNSLKENYRDIIEKVDLQEDTVGEAADTLNISRNNATVRLHRARSLLRKKVEAYCGVSSLSSCMSCTCSPPTEKPSR